MDGHSAAPTIQDADELGPEAKEQKDALEKNPYAHGFGLPTPCDLL